LDPVKCTTCGACAEICPANAITLHNKEQGGGAVDRDLCISCFCCQEICPERAIDIVPGRLLGVLRKVNLA
jgi:ferredoxin